MDKWADEELSARDYDSLTEEEKSLLEQLYVEYDAECGYDYYEDDYDDIENAEKSYSEIFYMDDEGNACDKAVAKRCIIRELDADGNLIQEIFGFVNDVPPVTLKDMGLSDDVDYREQPLEELPKDRKEAIIAEFMFLIDRLLPRNIQDLFYRIALDPRPAYWKAFEQAVCKMRLARYTDHNKNNYGQFIDHVQSGIMDMIADGMSIQDIYDSTCVTKSMLTETADALYITNFLG